MQEHPGEEKLACTNEFAIRSDSLLGMRNVFGIDFDSEICTMEKGVALKAAHDGEVAVCMADAADSAIVKYGPTFLAGGSNYFLAYNMVAVVRAVCGRASRYAAMKTGLTGFTKASADKLDMHNIQVNGLVPGYGRARSSVRSRKMQRFTRS